MIVGPGVLRSKRSSSVTTPPSNLSYSTSSAFYAKGSSISANNPTVTGTPTSYSISPSLPTGLSLDTSTGIITGTPTVGQLSTSYTVTATNSGGSTNCSITIAVTVNISTLSPYHSFYADDTNGLWTNRGEGTPSTTDGATVGAWKQRGSANGDDVGGNSSACTLKLNQYNGLATIRMPGDSLDQNTKSTNTGTAHFTAWHVFTINDIASARWLLFLGSAGTNLNYGIRHAAGTSALKVATSPADVLTLSTSFSQNTLYLVTVVWDGTNVTAYVNGVVDAAGSQAASFNIGQGTALGGEAVGGNTYWSGDWCQFGMVSGDVSASDRAGVDAYLKHKWGLS